MSVPPCVGRCGRCQRRKNEIEKQAETAVPFVDVAARLEDPAELVRSRARFDGVCRHGARHVIRLAVSAATCDMLDMVQRRLVRPPGEITRVSAPVRMKR